jgi:hypothetical protein
MRKTFAPLDDVLIERLFQPFADMLTGHTGISRATTSCLCIDIASLAWIVSRAGGLSGAVTAWDCGDAFVDLMLLLLGLVALISLRALFRRTAPKKQANPLRLAMQPHRAIVLLMLASRLAQLHAPDLPSVADVVMLMCATSALYLGACAERPPLRRQRASLAPAPVQL